MMNKLKTKKKQLQNNCCYSYCHYKQDYVEHIHNKYTKVIFWNVTLKLTKIFHFIVIVEIVEFQHLFLNKNKNYRCHNYHNINQIECVCCCWSCIYITRALDQPQCVLAQFQYGVIWKDVGNQYVWSLRVLVFVFTWQDQITRYSVFKPYQHVYSTNRGFPNCYASFCQG